ncbi:MAG: RNA methyltransferase [Deltaproteobacteria bacterium]|nr:RNA methyltransferase [Deltaproteobacteria bacterium]
MEDKNPHFEALRKNISIVLVEPQSAGNIGSTARVLKNTGLKNLVLVNPAEYKNDEGFSFACNAGDALLGARVFRGLREAVKGSPVVIGTTRRKGRIRHPTLTLDEAVPRIVALAQKNAVSILFGREDRGLENEEVPLCDMLMEIPAHAGYPSLNLSHAVFAVCYALFRAGLSPEAAIKAAPKNEVEEMYAHLERVLEKLGYGDAARRGEFLLKSIMRNFHKLFGRSALMGKEVNMLRGILASVEGKLQRREAQGVEQRPGRMAGKSP